MSFRFWFKIFNIVMFLGALSMSGLGMYGSGKAIQEAFNVSSATSFGMFYIHTPGLAFVQTLISVSFFSGCSPPV
jgi:hypothetical protein